MVDILTCNLQFKMKSKAEFPFLMLRLFLKINHLPFLFTVNLPLGEFIRILTDIYHLPLSLALFTHSFIDTSKYAKVGLNNTLN